MVNRQTINPDDNPPHVKSDDNPADVNPADHDPVDDSPADVKTDHNPIDVRPDGSHMVNRQTVITQQTESPGVNKPETLRSPRC